MLKRESMKFCVVVVFLNDRTVRVKKSVCLFASRASLLAFSLAPFSVTPHASIQERARSSQRRRRDCTSSAFRNNEHGWPTALSGVLHASLSHQRLFSTDNNQFHSFFPLHVQGFPLFSSRPITTLLFVYLIVNNQ